jgi:hypothetical protein
VRVHAGGRAGVTRAFMRHAIAGFAQSGHEDERPLPMRAKSSGSASVSLSSSPGSIAYASEIELAKLDRLGSRSSDPRRPEREHSRARDEERRECGGTRTSVYACACYGKARENPVASVRIVWVRSVPQQREAGMEMLIVGPVPFA